MMMQPEQKVGAASTEPQATGEETNVIMTDTMDKLSRIRAMKVFNVILVRLWRRRCSEIGDLHNLVCQYQTKVKTMRDDLFSRNRMICEEQRRCDRLQSALGRFKPRMDVKLLRRELEDKTLECNDVAELLDATRTEMFRELSKHRQCAQLLAQQQRHNQWLEMSNLELEDELMTLKDKFQMQHDQHCAALHMKHEQLKEAYETLLRYEQELVKLQIKHFKLIKDSRVEIAETKRRLELLRKVIRYIIAHRWPNVKFIVYEIMSRSLTYIQHHTPLAVSELPITGVGICFGIVLLTMAIK